MAKIIEIENVQSGMVVAKSIVNRFGQMILPEGTKITDKHKRVLKTWGVKYVTVEGFLGGDIVNSAEVDPLEGFDERIKNQAEEYLKKKMCWTPRNASETGMYNAALGQIIEKISKKKNDDN